LELKSSCVDEFIKKHKNHSGFIEDETRLKNVMKWLKEMVINNDKYCVLRITECYDDMNRSTYSVWYDDRIGSWVYFVMSREEFFKWFEDERINIVKKYVVYDNSGFNRVSIEIKNKELK
jgi:hypothetical protein